MKENKSCFTFGNSTFVYDGRHAYGDAWCRCLLLGCGRPPPSNDAACDVDVVVKKTWQLWQQWQMVCLKKLIVLAQWRG